MRKKILACVMAFAMVLSIAGCGSSSKAAEPSKSASDAAGTSAASADTSAFGLVEDGTLNVVMSAGYAPFDWLQDDDSNGAFKTENGSYINGYDVMFAEKLADAFGLKLKITQVDWNGLILSIQTGKADCAIAGMSITDERKQSVDFSEPYYNADLCVVVDGSGSYAGAKNLTDLKGARITAGQGTVWYDVLDQVRDYADVQPAMNASSFAQYITAINADKLDAFSCDIPSAKSLIKTNPNLKMIDFAGGTGFVVDNSITDLGIPVKKGNTALQSAINDVLAGISQDDRNKMMDDAVAAEPANAIE